MNNPGSPSAEPQTRSRWQNAPAWLVLGVLALGLVLALVVGTQVIGVLYAIFVPPPPPIIEGAAQLRHTPIAHGVDEWVYGTDLDGCEVMRYYRDLGNECRIAPNWCNDPGQGLTFEAESPGQHVARCVGERSFSIFNMRWEVIIATNYTTDGRTHFHLSREVFWGSSPQMSG